MEQALGSSSERIATIRQISAVLSLEAKLHMFMFALLVPCLEVYLLWSKDEKPDSRFIFLTVGLFFFYSLLQHVFEIFVQGRGPAVFSLLPSILLFFLLRNMPGFYAPHIAVIVSVSLRLLFILLPYTEKIIDYASFVLAAVSLYLYFSFGSFKSGELINVLLFVCLTILIISFIQKLLIEKNKEGFPIFIFLITGLLITVIPVREEPIDWTYVIAAGERFTENLAETIDQLSYFFSDVFDADSFASGYSSLGKAGGNIASSEKTQLILRTPENPFFTFKDPETGTNKIRRRTIYLAGGRLSDTEGLINFAHFLKSHEVDKEYASLFARNGRLSIEYGYLKTNDEIAPINSVLLTNDQGKNISERSFGTHKKGYTLNTSYLDIDYGSPYLIELIKNTAPAADAMTYEDCRSYLSSVLGIDLAKIIDPDEYQKYISADDYSEYLDTKGASKRMQDLAEELTTGTMDTYDKCRIIENYLRQYTYSTSAQSVNSDVVDLATSSGMSRMADSFLFDTGYGYCVHYASSMTMLLRLSGIPARIVTGYRYVFPFEKEESYKVSSTNAHAWPEAYIENVGWIPFEPTTVYLTASDRSWNKALTEMTVTDYAPVYDSVPHLPETIVDEPEPVVERALNIAFVIIPVIASILLLLLILIFGSRAIDKLRYHYSTPAQKLRMDVDKIKKSLRRSSAEGFIDRGLIYDYISLAPSDFSDDLKKVFALYYRLEYSTYGNIPTPEETAFAKSVREEVLRLSGRNS